MNVKEESPDYSRDFMSILTLVCVNVFSNKCVIVI
jgi:hypothetical protein